MNPLERVGLWRLLEAVRVLRDALTPQPQPEPGE